MENISSLDIFIAVVAIIFFLLWAVYVVRIIFARRKARNRNRLILKQYQQALEDRALIRSLKDRLDESNEKVASLRAELTGTQEDGQGLPEESGRILRRMEDAIRASRLYAAEKPATREDVMNLVHLEKKEFEAVLKAGGVTLDGILDGMRLEAALPLLKEAAGAEKPEDGSDPVANAAIAAGFSGKRALGRSVKDALGMSLDELLEII